MTDTIEFIKAFKMVIPFTKKKWKIIIVTNIITTIMMTMTQLIKLNYCYKQNITEQNKTK